MKAKGLKNKTITKSHRIAIPVCHVCKVKLNLNKKTLIKDVSWKGINLCRNHYEQLDAAAREIGV